MARHGSLAGTRVKLHGEGSIAVDAGDKARERGPVGPLHYHLVHHFELVVVVKMHHVGWDSFVRVALVVFDCICAISIIGHHKPVEQIFCFRELDPYSGTDIDRLALLRRQQQAVAHCCDLHLSVVAHHCERAVTVCACHNAKLQRGLWRDPLQNHTRVQANWTECLAVEDTLPVLFRSSSLLSPKPLLLPLFHLALLLLVLKAAPNVRHVAVLPTVQRLVCVGACLHVDGACLLLGGTLLRFPLRQGWPRHAL
mmetsp:Transcript_6675/g.12597  ORF Transcript_6675/g.12597 Transcript_6675/m.12597 type:complete len:254 (+) Transcript_6675:1423-2184(+)